MIIQKKKILNYLPFCIFIKHTIPVNQIIKWFLLFLHLQVMHQVIRKIQVMNIPSEQKTQPVLCSSNWTIFMFSFKYFRKIGVFGITSFEVIMAEK